MRLVFCDRTTGTMACDADVEEYGDYKQLAYVFNEGFVKWYVPKNTLPADVITRIEDVAKKRGDDWESRFSAIRPDYQYYYLLDKVPQPVYDEVIKSSESLDVKVAHLKKVYFAIWEQRCCS